MQTFEERLITAILTQAVEDAKYTGLSKKYLRHKIEAINWILSDDPQFNYYCKLLNIAHTTGENIQMTLSWSLLI